MTMGGRRFFGPAGLPAISSEPSERCDVNLLTYFNEIVRRANHFRYSEMMSSPKIKNISLLPKCKSVFITAIPARRGASAIVTNVGPGCGGRDSVRHG
jgi:hypothetical protein